jgi:DNA-binding transcriptional LysR family regulator
MDEHVNAQMQHFTLVPELLARTNYVSTLPVRLAGRYRARLEIFELPFEARGFTLFAVWPPRSQADPAQVWLRDTLAGLEAS